VSDESRMPRDPVPTGVELTPLDPAFRANPYPVLARLRAREPVHYDDVIKRWVLTRGGDVESLLRDRTMAKDGRKANEGTYMRLIASSPEGRDFGILLLDPPEHTRLRSLVSKAFERQPREAPVRARKSLGRRRWPGHLADGARQSGRRDRSAPARSRCGAHAR